MLNEIFRQPSVAKKILSGLFNIAFLVILSSPANAIYSNKTYPENTEQPQSSSPLLFAGLAIESEGEAVCIVTPNSDNIEAMEDVANKFQTDVALNQKVSGLPECDNTEWADLAASSTEGFAMDIQVASPAVLGPAPAFGGLVATGSCLAGVGAGALIRSGRYLGKNPSTDADYFWSAETATLSAGAAAFMTLRTFHPIQTAFVAVPAFLCSKLGSKIVDGVSYLTNVKIKPLFRR